MQLLLTDPVDAQHSDNRMALKVVDTLQITSDSASSWRPRFSSFIERTITSNAPKRQGGDDDVVDDAVIEVDRRSIAFSLFGRLASQSSAFPPIVIAEQSVSLQSESKLAAEISHLESSLLAWLQKTLADAGDGDDGTPPAWRLLYLTWSISGAAASRAAEVQEASPAPTLLFSEEDIHEVMEGAGVDRQAAVQALKESDGDAGFAMGLALFG